MFPLFAQVLTQKLEQATKSKIYLIKKLDKAKEEMDDLRFQVGVFLSGFSILSPKSSGLDHCLGTFVSFTCDP